MRTIRADHLKVGDVIENCGEHLRIIRLTPEMVVTVRSDEPLRPIRLSRMGMFDLIQGSPARQKEKSDDHG